MIKEMTSYFAGEKQESILFMAVGLIAIGVAVWLWTQGHRLRFMAVPLVVVALMQMVVGITIYARTDAQLQGLAAQYQSAPLQFKQEETVRMQTVMRQFKVYKAIELALLVLGIGLVAFLSKSDMATGIGIGLLLQASFTLALDLFAEARGDAYLLAVGDLLI